MYKQQQKDGQPCKGMPAFATVPHRYINNNNNKQKDEWPGVHQLLLPPHLGFKEKMDSQGHTSFCHCPTWVYQQKKKKKQQQKKEKPKMDGQGTPTPATTPLRLKRKSGQPRAYQLWLQSQVGEQKRWLKRKDGQPRAHQLLLLSQVSVKKNKNMPWPGIH